LCERPQLLKERSQEVTENVAEVALRQNCTYVVEPRGPSCPPRALRSGPPDDGGRAKRDERSAPRRRGHVREIGASESRGHDDRRSVAVGPNLDFLDQVIQDARLGR